MATTARVNTTRILLSMSRCESLLVSPLMVTTGVVKARSQPTKIDFKFFLDKSVSKLFRPSLCPALYVSVVLLGTMLPHR